MGGDMMIMQEWMITETMTIWLIAVLKSVACEQLIIAHLIPYVLFADPIYENDYSLNYN